MSQSFRPGAAGLLLAALLLLPACLTTGPAPGAATPTPSGPPLPPVGGRIAYLSTRDGGQRELRVINPDGSRDTRLTPGASLSGPAVWSPDGARLAYPVDQKGKAQLVALAVNADNSPGAAVILSADAPTSDNTSPVWSPDGKAIAFQSNRTGSYQIYTVPAAGGPVQSFPNQPAYARQPAWSPDGKTLVFSGGASSTATELYSVAAAGGSPVQITNSGRAAALPEWAPDGASLLFLAQTSDGTHNIAQVHPDGGGERTLTTPPPTPPDSGTRPRSPDDLYPVWSPDGAWIAFFSNRPGENDIYVMDKDGAALTDLTNSPAGDIFPSWAPDGSRLVYASRGDEGYRLRIVARDGTHLTPLTDGSGAYDDSFPTWSAAARK